MKARTCTAPRPRLVSRSPTATAKITATYRMGPCQSAGAQDCTQGTSQAGWPSNTSSTSNGSSSGSGMLAAVAATATTCAYTSTRRCRRRSSTR